MAAELMGNKIEAFNLYEPVKMSALRHIALKKMLPIAIELEDYPAALEVLDRLIKINLDYMVPYADLLAVLGNKAGAIEVMGMYLQKHPDKISIKNKMASLCLEIDQRELAEKLIKQVLSVDEDNTAALQMQELLSTTSQ